MRDQPSNTDTLLLKHSHCRLDRTLLEDDRPDKSFVSYISLVCRKTQCSLLDQFLNHYQPLLDYIHPLPHTDLLLDYHHSNVVPSSVPVVSVAVVPVVAVVASVTPSTTLLTFVALVSAFALILSLVEVVLSTTLFAFGLVLGGFGFFGGLGLFSSFVCFSLSRSNLSSYLLASLGITTVQG